MLQLLLAILAISMVSFSGWALVEQVHLQQVSADQAETIRRLDVAAKTIEGMTGTLPGSSAILAPAPSTGGGAYPYAQMPANKGGFNATASGIPFLYCPLAPASGSSSNLQLPDGDGFAVDVRGGLVTGSSLVSAPVAAQLAGYNPVAVIVAASLNSNVPPSCKNVVVGANGRPTVLGGIVRVVSQPAGAGAANTLMRESSDIYVDATGAGTGRFANSPTSIDAALAHWVNFKPSAMTIHVLGPVTASSGVWGGFANALAGNASRLAIIGETSDAAIIAPVGNLASSMTMTLSNVAFPNTSLIVTKGAAVSLDRLVSFSAAGQDGVFVSGDLSLANATVAGGSASVIHVGAGGRLSAIASQIGGAGGNGVGLLADGTWSISSDNVSTVIQRASGCWASASGDLTFAYSTGSISPVPQDPAFTGNPQDETAVSAWKAQIDGMRRARQSNSSNFTCVSGG